MNRNRALEALRHHSDDDLFALSQEQGSREAVAVLFDRYHARVHAWCVRIQGDTPRAEDVAQDIFLRLLDRRLQYRRRGAFGAWLYVMTRNACLNAKRAQKHEAGEEDTEFEVWREALVSKESPALDAERSHMAEHLKSACRESLSDLETRVIYLRYYWGLRVKEINAHLQLDNASGARTHLATAKRKLRDTLSRRLTPEELTRILGKDPS